MYEIDQGLFEEALPAQPKRSSSIRQLALGRLGLGRPLFQLRLAKAALGSHRQAKDQAEALRAVFGIEGISGAAENVQDFYARRRDELFAAQQQNLIQHTVDFGLGSENFLDGLLAHIDD